LRDPADAPERRRQEREPSRRARGPQGHLRDRAARGAVRPQPRGQARHPRRLLPARAGRGALAAEGQAAAAHARLRDLARPRLAQRRRQTAAAGRPPQEPGGRAQRRLRLADHRRQALRRGGRRPAHGARDLLRVARDRQDRRAELRDGPDAARRGRAPGRVRVHAGADPEVRGRGARTPGTARLSRAALALAALALGPLAPAAAAPGATRVLKAVRSAGEIHLDGRLDEAAWQAAPVADGFLQRDPDQGQPASEPTELRLLFDDHALYAGVRLRDAAPGAISRQLSRRDTLPEADSFALYLDPQHDHRNGVVLEVSAAGVQRDAALYDDNFEDVTWDAVWESAVSRDESGWTLELRLPFSQLRFPSVVGH